MLVFLGVLVGAVLGATIARKREGKRLDMLHYACGYGIAFGLLGVFLTLAAGWLGI